jgi:DNA-directed RNA polymerase specialized sigma24 family protein
LALATDSRDEHSMANPANLAQSRPMTRDEYGNAYQAGFPLTVHFLVSRGLVGDDAGEAAQAAWARGWERIKQLRSGTMVVAWVNSIALNLHRSVLRKPAFEALHDISAPTEPNFASLDSHKILNLCNSYERTLLKQLYLDGLRISEIAHRHGCSETAARIRILRARRAIRARLSHG